MKHPYRLDCLCARCAKERARRGAQADTDPRRAVPAAQAVTRRARRFARIARRERAYADWCLTDDGPGDYEINGPDREGGL